MSNNPETPPTVTTPEVKPATTQSMNQSVAMPSVPSENQQTALPTANAASSSDAKPAETTPQQAATVAPLPIVTETSFESNVSDATVREQLKIRGISVDDFAESYIFSDPKTDRDRLIAQTLLFSDYIENHTYRLLGGNIGSILDLGCGEGQLTSIFKKIYPDADVTGLDIDPRALEVAKQNQDKLPGYGSKIHYIAGNIEEDLPNGPFDLIHVSMVLLQTRNPKKVLELAKKSLKPGGYLWIKEPVTDLKMQHPAYLNIADLTIRAMTKAGHNPLAYTQLPQMLADLGFYDIKIETENYPVNLDTLSGRISMGVTLGIFRNATKMISRVLTVPEPEVLELYNEMCRDANKLRGVYTLMNFIARRSENVVQSTSL